MTAGALLLAALWLAGPARAEAPPPSARLWLQDSPLAGFQYHAGRELWARLRVGDALELVREPDNVHDASAVRVDWQGRKLGYVPRRDNADLARLMDHGARATARIAALREHRDPWQRVRMEIYLDF